MKSVLIPLISLTMLSTAQAHSVWINCFESKSHPPMHAMVSLGWGHAMPMDDILNSVNGKITIDKFELIEPDLTVTPLLLPTTKTAEAVVSKVNFDTFAADLAAQKIALKKECAPGVYQLSAVSKPGFFTQYIDKKGKTRLQLKPKNEIDDIDKILMCVKYEAFAKAFFINGNWSKQKPLGHGLEIVPLTDMSDLHSGDLVEVQVLFYGEPVNTTAESMDFITAHSSSFGQSDGFKLQSFLMNGKGQFRVQSAGQWMVSINHKQDVTEDGPLKDLFGKTDQVYHSASFTFTVR